MKCIFLSIFSVTLAQSNPMLRNLQCVMCPAVVPECEEDCGNCMVTQQGCQTCPQAICQDGCIFCPAFVPTCEEECALCQYIPQTCDSCAAAVCRD
eukprot:snap_masked-scaffold_8-processed-gene-3.24-mRNA-1 protein AED:1.00 eAED:1.00 QI:0/-1/0/0/-1/1/1/0/95